MKNKADRIAIIDIGSNSVRLFLFKIEQGKTEQLSAMKHFCGLGRDLGTTGKLNPEAVELTKNYLSVFREEIEKNAIEREFVIGTAALREASDAAAFLQSVRETSGFNIKIIEGEEEARLAALAVLSTDRQASGLVADFGGGSLELARIGNGHIEKKVSLRLGAHYLKALPERDSGIEKKLAQALEQNPELENPETLYIIGGSWRSLAKAWLQDMDDGDQELEGFSFEAEEILDFCRGIQSKTPEDLIKTYKMEAPRAELMDVSALMLAKMITCLKPAKIRVSTAGIRDGLAYDYILTRQE